MTGPAEFSFAEAERILGPAAMAEADRLAAEAPPLSPEQRARLRALFVSAHAIAALPAADAA